MRFKTETALPDVDLAAAKLDQVLAATAFYADLLGTQRRRPPAPRHYFDCGGVVLAVLDITEGRMRPTPGPKSIYFAVENLDEVHTRANSLDTLAPFQVHEQPAGDIVERPWGERSFYVIDPWGNELCFVQEGTLYT